MIGSGLMSQNAPITTAGYITNATTGPGAVIVPVTVKDFANIGAFKLTLIYKSSYVSYVGFTPHPSLPGMTVANTVVGTVGKLIITWPETAGGVTLPDESQLLSLTFTYISSTSYLNWSTNSDSDCYYKKYSGGSYILLSDNPATTYYINGGISNRGAPVTSAAVIANPAPGTISVPLTVNNFTSIGVVNLNLEYNPSVLTYQNCTMNGSLGGSGTIGGTNPGTDGKLLVTISWTIFGGVSLPNGSTLATIVFTYSNTNGTWSGLDFYETGTSCEYADQFANPLIDSPTSDYYHNGLVYTQYAPRTWLPVIKNATPSAAIAVPVYANDFNNVRSFNLSFEYSNSVMTYSGFTPSPEFGSALTAADSPSGSKRKVTLNWAGTADKTLAAGSLLGTVNFNYISGTTALTWIINDLVSCRFNDANGNAYCDAPKSVYYQDGLVASHVAPVTVCGQQSTVGSQQVVVPVAVYDFSNIGSFALTLDYDPSVLTYQNATLLPSIGGTFTAATAGLGRILLNWSGTAASLTDSTHLLDLTFYYNGETTTLAWFDDGNSCRFSETSGGASLYDLPRSDFYINGYVGSAPLTASFTANPVIGGNETTVIFSDLSTGGPTSWNWIINPASYYFINGTSASSQNPQIKFASNGAYSVMLVVSKGTAGAARIRKEYLHIGIPGLWTGITSTAWTTASNWHNYLLPTASANVILPSNAPNWPQIAGDLTLGALCGNMTLQNEAQLTVDGNVTINPGRSLVFEGAGTLSLKGNWLNQGNFSCGTGTVEFTGQPAASIISNSSPETFYRIILSKSGTACVSIQGIILVTGVENE